MNEIKFLSPTPYRIFKTYNYIYFYFELFLRNKLGSGCLSRLNPNYILTLLYYFFHIIHII